MASIAKREDGRWRARYRDEAGKEHAKHFARKVDADRWLSLQTAAVLRGEWVDPQLGKTTFRQYAEGWRVSQAQHRPSTAIHLETMLRRHAYPTFGDRPLASIKTSDIRAWVASLSTSLAPSTIKVLHSQVASVFNAAVADRCIPSSPCQRSGRSGGNYLPKVAPKRVEPMETETVQLLADVVQPRYRALILLAAGTGLRQGECLGLTVDRVDFLRRTVTVDRQIGLVTEDALFGPPKTDASYRTVPLPQVVLDALAAHLAEFGPGIEGLLFTTENGRPLRRNALSATVWQPAARKAGLKQGVTFHDLRHFYASLLIRHSESVKVVQARLGHSTASQTLDTYAHLWPDSDDRTREAVDDVLGANTGAKELAR